LVPPRSVGWHVNSVWHDVYLRSTNPYFDKPLSAYCTGCNNSIEFIISQIFRSPALILELLANVIAMGVPEGTYAELLGQLEPN
jgi:hypothetical protein